jgi:hypothetical protein
MNETAAGPDSRLTLRSVARSAADDVLRLGPLLALADVEGHMLALGQLAVPAALDL